MSNYLLISDAAKEVKVESHVLRYWEEELNLPINRNELGHRYYTAEDVERFKQIKSMKERGLQLKAIKMILKDGKLSVMPEAEGRSENGQAGTDRNDKSNEAAGRFDLHADSMTERGEQGMSEIHGRSDSYVDRQAEQENVTVDKAGKNRESGGLAIDIINSRECDRDALSERRHIRRSGQEVSAETREDKARRLQWLLQQLIRETLQENNQELCRDIKESVVKELDYQFRMQEEREEERERRNVERGDVYYKKMDELLRKKSRRLVKEEPAVTEKKEKKKRHSIF